jgi:glycerol uptake facilitator-like aquaporin
MITTTLLVGAFFGDTSAVVPPNLGMYAILAGLAHVPALLVALRDGIRVNPYISLVEYLYGKKRMPFAVLCAEILAQAIGATAAAASVYLVIYPYPAMFPGLSGIIPDAGRGMFLAAFAGVFLAISYFENSQALAYTIAFLVVISFQSFATTTHNPFRWVAACVLEGTCGAANGWVYPVGPLVGVFIGMLLMSVGKNIRIFVY